MTVRHAPFLVATAMLAACGPRPIADAELAGRYVHATEDFAPASTLEVRKDHTFEVRCAADAGDPELGNWRLLRRDRRTLLAVRTTRLPQRPGDCIVLTASGVTRIERTDVGFDIVPPAGAPFQKVR